MIKHPTYRSPEYRHLRLLARKIRRGERVDPGELDNTSSQVRRLEGDSDNSLDREAMESVIDSMTYVNNSNWYGIPHTETSADARDMVKKLDINLGRVNTFVDREYMVFQHAHYFEPDSREKPANAA